MNVDINLEDFNTGDMIVELEQRGYVVLQKQEITDLYDLYKPDTIKQFDVELKRFFYEYIGRIV